MLVTLIYVASMVLVVVGFVKIRNKQHINSENLEQKKISVIVPVRNEEKNILECLLALEEQYYDENNFEVIVVNDHSSDGTVDKVNGFIQLHQINVHLFSLTEKTGKKENRDNSNIITNKTLSPNIKLLVLIYKFLTAFLKVRSIHLKKARSMRFCCFHQLAYLSHDQPLHKTGPLEFSNLLQAGLPMLFS